MRDRTKKTNWARRDRDVYDSFTGVRIAGDQLASLKRIADLLNIDVSDLLRSFIAGFAALPVKSTVPVDPEPPTTSYKMRSEVKQRLKQGRKRASQVRQGRD